MRRRRNRAYKSRDKGATSPATRKGRNHTKGREQEKDIREILARTPIKEEDLKFVESSEATNAERQRLQSMAAHRAVLNMTPASVKKAFEKVREKAEVDE